MNRPPEISSTAAAPIATTQGLRTCTGRIPAPSRILEVLIANALSSAKTSPRCPSATHVAAKPFASANRAHSTISATESTLLGWIPSASRFVSIMGVSSLQGASVAVSLKPKPLHFRLRGAGAGVDWREHLRCRLNTDFNNLLEGIVGPQDLCDPSMSLGVIFHDLGAALEPKTPTGKRVDDVEFDRGVVPEVLDGAWRRELGEPQFVVAKDGG